MRRKNDMARYIDADELLNKLPDVLPYKASVKRVLTQAPEVDVVPKSEVDNLKVLLEMTDKAYYSLKELYHTDTEALVEARIKTEIEVAREIFGDVKKAIKEEVRDYCRGFESMETPEMQEYYKTKQNTAIYLYMKIDHLEKKYTEDKKDENQN